MARSSYTQTNQEERRWDITLKIARNFSLKRSQLMISLFRKLSRNLHGTINGAWTTKKACTVWNCTRFGMKRATFCTKLPKEILFPQAILCGQTLARSVTKIERRTTFIRGRHRPLHLTRQTRRTKSLFCGLVHFREMKLRLYCKKNKKQRQLPTVRVSSHLQFVLAVAYLVVRVLLCSAGTVCTMICWKKGLPNIFLQEKTNFSWQRYRLLFQIW